MSGVDDLLAEFDDLPSANKRATSQPSQAAAELRTIQPPQISQFHIPQYGAPTRTLQSTLQVPQRLHTGIAKPQCNEVTLATAHSGPIQPTAVQQPAKIPTRHIRACSEVVSHNSIDSLLQDLDIQLATSPGTSAGPTLGNLKGSGGGAVGSSGRASATAIPLTNSAAVHRSCTMADAHSARHSVGGSTSGTARSKCAGLFLGGVQVGRGRNGSVPGAVQCCDAVRCTKCDFRVLEFNDREWDSSVEYLFFRNNYPTHDKLQAMLRAKRGCVAYCCQCSWQSCVSETRVDFGGDLRWVCAGHIM